LKENYIKITEILYVTVLWEVAFHCFAQEKEILRSQATQLGFVLCNKLQIKEFYNTPLNIVPKLKARILGSPRLKKKSLSTINIQTRLTVILAEKNPTPFFHTSPSRKIGTHHWKYHLKNLVLLSVI